MKQLWLIQIQLWKVGILVFLWYDYTDNEYLENTAKHYLVHLLSGDSPTASKKYNGFFTWFFADFTP